MEQYSIRLECFEGPMELLMHLIEKNKIDIYDIPMAALTEQYMDYLDKFRSFNIEIASEFITMAAKLLQIKSRMLLPKSPKLNDEAEEEVDPRQELIERILEYRRFREVSTIMCELQQEQGKVFCREPMSLSVRHLPPKSLSLNELLEAFANALAVKKELQIPQALIEPDKFSVQDKMEILLELLHKSKGRIKFIDAFTSGRRSELITTFLAMLELIKLQTISVQQEYQYGDIYISDRYRASENTLSLL